MQQLLEQELVHEDESFDATPVCGGNFQTPVADMTYYYDELRWVIGGRTFIENAD